MKLKHMALILFCIYIVAVILLCIIRTDNIPELPKFLFGIPLDKVTHFIMFLPFPILGYTAFYPAVPSIWREFAILGLLCILGLGFAVSTEQLQALTDYRSCELTDLVADFTGIFTGVSTIIIEILRKHR